MTFAASRAARILTAALLGTCPLYTAPAATAVAPPAVDESLLPKPGSPAPPRRTEQQQQCAAFNAGTDESATAGQLKGLDLPAIWRLSRGAGQTVAVIDTGVSRHRLLPHLVPGGDYVFTGDGTEDCDGHGTIVAGIIGAAPDEAATFSGIAPDATIIAIRQSSNNFRAADDASGSGFGDVDTLAMAVRTAADMGATVINVSSVACLPADGGLDDRALGAALSYAVDVKNAVVVAAAGNVGGSGQCPDQNPVADPARPGQPNWDDVKVVASPAWYDEYVLTVGSIGPDGGPSQFSLAGPWVDVAAPGEGIVSLDPDGEGFVDTLPGDDGGKPITGTSYAAPVVSGVAALLRSRSPELTARQVMQRIEETAHRAPAGWDPVVGSGVVDVLAALTAGRPAQPPPNGQPVRSVAMPAETTTDPRPRRVALQGAAVCLAVSAATIAMMASAGRLRRRPDAVPHD
ncbi:type VII secretion-associated serine protease mycosin [Mycobacterium sp.]|uniref:type VII secretion-associated serine protease mycosin n=1 Tax=Mycobacterium sp. TaxID=1785 RepID=UPI002D8FB21F|nr:type VII secretion-associated serine protease mycosin [Mycobacterium sp.]